MNEICEFGHMLTVTGVHFNLLDPDPSKIKIEDIAHGLAYTCRWNGHTKTYYSVAEHSMRVHDEFSNYTRNRGMYSRKRALAALLHDAEEAYWGDIIRPIKNMYPEIEEEILKLRLIIMNKFDADYIGGVENIIKADDIVLKWEYNNVVCLSKCVTEHPFLVKQKFLSLFDILTENKRVNK